MRTNRAFERLAGGAADVSLEPRLRGIVTSPVVERQDCMFWSALVPDGALPTAGLDETGLEALVNKVHVDDFVAPPALVAQSLAALQLAAASLQGHGPLCLVLSLHLEQPTAVLRSSVVGSTRRGSPNRSRTTRTKPSRSSTCQPEARPNPERLTEAEATPPRERRNFSRFRVTVSFR